MTASLIEMAGVSKTYAASDGLVHAVDGVSLDVGLGEFVSVLGPSGCGKSTLLLMIAGLLPPSAGKIRVAERAVTRPQTDVGIVFQNPVLLDWRTVIRNVLLQIEARGLDLAAHRLKARDLLRRSASRASRRDSRSSCLAACASAPRSVGP